MDRPHLPEDPGRQRRVWIFPISVLLVFLVLAAQYESLTLPLAVILIVPMSILAALTGVWLTGGDNNIFTRSA
jgi:multidrug efflux pump